MRQADNAALWMRENQPAPAHTHVETRTHTRCLISAQSRVPFKRPESWRRGNKYSALLLRERDREERQGDDEREVKHKGGVRLSHTHKNKEKPQKTTLVLVFIYLFRQPLVNALQIQLVAAYIPSLVQGESDIDFQPLTFCFPLFLRNMHTLVHLTKTRLGTCMQTLVW